MKLSNIKLKDNEFFKGVKIVIHPDDETIELFKKFDSLFRYVYNWGISKEEEAYEKYKLDKSKSSHLSFISLSILYDYELKNNPELSFLKELPLNSAREALKEVDNAYQMFFKGYNKVPKYRKKDRNLLSFRTRSERSYIENGEIRVEGLPRGVKIPCNYHEYDNIGCRKTDTQKLYNPSINFNGDYYTFSFQIISEKAPLEVHRTGPVGVDLGIHNPAVTSDGIYYKQPNLNKLDKRIARMQRKVAKDRKRRTKIAITTKTKSEDIPMSKRSIKRSKNLRKLQRKRTNIMTDFYNKTAIDIIKNNPSAVCLETIRPGSIMGKFPSSHKYMHKVAMSKFSGIIRNQCVKRSIPIIYADKEFPSSQMCSNCGNINKNIGGHRKYICPKCGTRLDRDFNASLNLRNLYYEFN